MDAGARIALGADDPLLFGPRLAAQYEAARQLHGFDDAGLADLARSSIGVSRAPADVKARLLAGIDDLALRAGDGQRSPLTFRRSRHSVQITNACKITAGWGARR